MKGEMVSKTVNRPVGQHVRHGRRVGRKIRRMEITPAENGFSSEIRREPAPSEKGYMDFDSPEVNVHPSVDHLVEHVRRAFGGAKKAAKEGGAG